MVYPGRGLVIIRPSRVKLVTEIHLLRESVEPKVIRSPGLQCWVGRTTVKPVRVEVSCDNHRVPWGAHMGGDYPHEQPLDKVERREHALSGADKVGLNASP